MPNLINSDSAGNVFLNYITPVIFMESGYTDTQIKANIVSAMVTAYGSGTAASWSDGIAFRPLAPGLETRTGTVTGTTGNSTANRFNIDGWRLSTTTGFNSNLKIWTGGAGTTTAAAFPSSFTNSPTYSISQKVIGNISPYSSCFATFNSNNTLSWFVYAGYLRESSYTGNVAPSACCIILHMEGVTRSYFVKSVGVSSLSAINTSADIITSPPIFCTEATEPSSGSATFTDVVIRDAAAPYTPAGKLWNCIDMPASCNVGELWRNTGEYDADGTSSTQDVYLCIMPWGQRKLGMRVWTENIM